ncbi:MAG: polysaccharide deacetylase family protein [Christensenellales bacterium]
MFLVVKRKSLIVGFALVLAFAISLVCVSVGNAQVVFFGTSTRKVPVYSVETEEKVVALTFDAAWGADKTKGIIEIMNNYGAKGTFFLVGFWIDKYPEETKFIADSGFDIGNHSENHPHMTKLSKDDISTEISSVNDKLQKITGKTPIYFRAPFGDYNNLLLSTLEEKSMVGVQWSIDSLDWKGLSGGQISERILPRVKNGDIVLFHNNSDHVLDALPIVLEGLKNKGFKLVTLSELVATQNYKIDANGVQHVTH